MKIRDPRKFCLAAGLLIISGCWMSAVEASPAVRADLQAKWNFTNPVLEAAEFFASENIPKYYEYLVDASLAVKQQSPAKYEDWYQIAINTAKSGKYCDSQAETAIFKLYLSLHAGSPAIISWQQYYEGGINEKYSDVKDCGVWFHWGNTASCDLKEISNLVEKHSSDDSPKLEPNDRVYPPQKQHGRSPLFVLYADILDEGFHDFISSFVNYANQGVLSFALRYKPSKKIFMDSKLIMSGYGVEMAIKNTEYSVVDDQSKKDTEGVEEEAQKSILDTILEVENDGIAELSKEELNGLGLKAASLIIGTENPVKIFRDLVENFPKYARKLSTLPINDAVRSAVGTLQGRGLDASANALFLNGISVHLEDPNFYRLLRLIRLELKALKTFTLSGVNPGEARKLQLTVQKDSGEPKDNEFFEEMYDLLMDEEFIVWLNNIETDQQYEHWDVGIRSILTQIMPGQLLRVRKNIFSVVLVLDFSNKEALRFLAEDVIGMLKGNAPIRFGVVPLILKQSDSDAMKLGTLFYYLTQEFDINHTVDFLELMLDEHEKGEKSLFEIAEANLINFIKDLETKNENAPKTMEKIIEEGSQYVYDAKYARRLTKRLKLTGNSVFMNGRLFPFDENFKHYAVSTYTQHLRYLQEKVYLNLINDNVNIFEHFQNLPNVRQHNNPYLYESPSNPLLFTDLNGQYELLSELRHYIFEGEIEYEEIILTIPCINIWILTDFTTKSGAKLALDSLEYSKRGENMRVTFFDTSAQKTVSPKDVEISREKAKDALSQMAENGDNSLIGDVVINNIPEGWVDYKTGETFIVINGRIMGPLSEDEEFGIEDFQIVVPHEMHVRMRHIHDCGANELTQLRDRITVGDNSTSFIHLQAVLDPLTETAQEWIGILDTLSKMEGVSLEIFVNPQMHLDQTPIKRFYRTVLEQELKFDKNGNPMASQAEFYNMPQKSLFTMGIHTIPSWLVMPTHSLHDLDNIVPTEESVDATFTLQNILLEGHCMDYTGSKPTPPRGLQLALSHTDSDSITSDTIVMANLGHFQLKANPGIWSLDLREGRSKMLYNLTSTGKDGLSETTDLLQNVVIDDFEGPVLFPKVIKNSESSSEDLLSEHQDSLWENFKNTMTKTFVKSKQADINIFSVASGHLYERFMSIMILSVLKHTDKSVKFWFIENFLSPSFKNFLPAFSAAKGFEYELVTYKWPHWLRKQSEKQRKIWGYKILFLDVLFPLDLDKVIFVDADQIVRTDLYELVEMNLLGAPYAYTPFCDNRPEIDGFRFWKQGYWKEHLDNRPYHISALYVIDLHRFRLMAAGDILRDHYHQLSSDPNSLANLDQDLPNNLQHLVPIFSLPQDWLWCETWCSDESLKTAKTIDLCNNPMTKEHKLKRAKRLIPEWETYEQEINLIKQQQEKPSGHDEL